MDNGFNPAKVDINREKHRLSLAFGLKMFGDADHLIIPPIREQDGEESFKVIGTIQERLFIGVFTWRGGLPRFISLRRSNRREERAYDSEGRSG